MWEVFNKVSGKTVIDSANFPPNHSGFEANSRHIAQFSARPNIVRPPPDELTPAYGSQLYDKLCLLSSTTDQSGSVLRLKSLREIVRLSLVDDQHIARFMRSTIVPNLLMLIETFPPNSEEHRLTFRIMTTFWSRSRDFRDWFLLSSSHHLPDFEKLLASVLRDATSSSLGFLRVVVVTPDRRSVRAVLKMSSLRILDRLLGLLQIRDDEPKMVCDLSGILGRLLTDADCMDEALKKMVCPLLKDLVEKFGMEDARRILSRRDEDEEDTENVVQNDMSELALAEVVKCVGVLSKHPRARRWVVVESSVHDAVLPLVLRLKTARARRPHAFALLKSSKSSSSSLLSLCEEVVSALMFLSLHDEVKPALMQPDPEVLDEIAEWAVMDFLPVGIRLGCCQILCNACVLALVRERLTSRALPRLEEALQSEEQYEMRAGLERLKERICWRP